MDREVVARAILAPTEHRVAEDRRGGYACTCGAQWDWNRLEQDAARMHAALFQADIVIAAVAASGGSS